MGFFLLCGLLGAATGLVLSLFGYELPLWWYFLLGVGLGMILIWRENRA